MSKSPVVHLETDDADPTRCKVINGQDVKRSRNMADVTCKRCIGLVEGRASRFNNRYDTVRFQKKEGGK